MQPEVRHLWGPCCLDGSHVCSCTTLSESQQVMVCRFGHVIRGDDCAQMHKTQAGRCAQRASLSHHDLIIDRMSKDIKDQQMDSQRR